ncbi:MAG: dipeptide epimerase [Sphingomonadaceae bacterium]|nr:dipeptide epimerase [Sphingomonadaceae bacterium]
MGLRISATVERWPVAGQFIIARGAKTYVDVVVVAASDGTHVGMGEGTAIYYRGETAEKCLRQVEEVINDLEALDARSARLRAQMVLGPGAARNALDCALWNLEANAAGMPLWQLLGMDKPKPLLTAFTISLGDCATMEADAAEAASRGYSLLKLKLTGEGDRDRVATVRAGAPAARLIVDANESWGKLDITVEAAALQAIGVEMIEQPVPEGQDRVLCPGRALMPILADESCHSAADVERLTPFYDGVNIKLDKAGGLTEALKIADAAEAAGMRIMVGCMLSTSLGVAPAFIVAQKADWVDLDGPALLAQDRPDGFRFEGGKIIPAGAQL